jgi:hypothetical protein
LGRRRPKKKDSSDKDEDIVDLIVKKYTKKLPINYWVRTVNKSIKQFTSLQELRDRVPEIYPKLSPKIFTEVIEQCRMLSQLAGMVDVEDEADIEGRTDAKAPAWLSLPFSEAIAYFRKKIIIPTQRWDEFTAQNHDFAFTVSGLQRADLLEDVRWLVDQAITQGNDIETFKDQFERLIGRKGWRPSDKRIYTILDTNSRRAYAAGRYEQATSPEMLQSRPYWVWKHRDSVVPRPNHLALDNKAIAASDPFWKVAFPMCAWGCRCTAFTANDRLLQRMGAQILANPPNPKTIAEPGFQRAPGLSPEEDRQDVLSQGLVGLSPDIAALVKSTKESGF